MKYSIAFALSLLSSALSYASAACSCKPTSIDFNFKLSQACSSSTIVTGDGSGPIKFADCWESFGPDVEDLVPVEITGYKIKQYNEMSAEPVSTVEDPEVNYKDGDTLTVTFAPTSDPVKRVYFTLYGKNAEGFQITQRPLVVFSNDCMAYPVLQKGDTLGWLEVKSFGGISDDYSCICQDDSSFLVNGKEDETCEWVAKRPSTRCSRDWNTFTKCPTVCHPQCSSTTNECVDDPDATIGGKTEKTCAWVAEDAGKRCQKGNAFSKCPATCNPFCKLDCSDDADYLNGKGQNCDWVAEKPEKRCGKDARKPFKECSATCNPGCQAFPPFEFDV